MDPLERIEKKLDEVIYTLNGNGTPGLKTRIDRMEQFAASCEKRTWFIMTTAATGALGFLGLIGKTIWDIVTTRPH